MGTQILNSHAIINLAAIIRAADGDPRDSARRLDEIRTPDRSGVA